MPVTAEQLTNFLDTLRVTGSGIEAGDQQYLAAFELIATLAARGEWQESSDEGRILLAPVLASSPAQQTAFYQLFDAWFVPGRKRAQPPIDRLRETVRKHRAVVTPIAAAVAIACAGLAWWHFHPPVAPSPTSQEQSQSQAPAGGSSRSGGTVTVRVIGPGHAPLSGVTLRYAGRTATTQGGEAQLTAPSMDRPFWVLATRSELRPAVGYLSNLGVQNIVMEDLVLPPPSGWRRSFYLHYQLLRWIATALPLVLLLGYRLSLLWRHLQLRKWSQLGAPEARQLAVRTANDRLFPAAIIQTLARDLRRRRPGALRDLSILATAEATARENGYFTPVFSHRFETPEYVVLAERKNRRDHQALYYDELIARLHAEDVPIERFHFRGDPRVCLSPGLPPIGLGELSAVYGRHSLILCLDQHKLLDPVSGEPETWAAQLAQWRDRALLTPSPDRSELGFRDAAPGLRGLQTLAEKSEPAPAVQPLPSLIEGDTERWLDPVPPEPALVSRLAAQLRRYLGNDGYLLLSGCAVYPGIEWEITALLAEKLVPAGALQGVFESLIQLPWFRYGTMPDWLRRKLLSGLSEDNQRRARRALELLLKEVSEQRQAGALEVLPGRSGPQTDAEPVQDHVFLDFMSGRRVDPLDFAPPRGWRK